MSIETRGWRPPSLLLTVALGVTATSVDFLAAQGDVSPPVTLAVLLATACLLGWLAPARPWLAALALGSVLPAAHVFAHALGYPDNVSPDTYGARLLMAPVTIGAALFGTWLGGTLHRPPPSPPRSLGRFPTGFELSSLKCNN